MYSVIITNSSEEQTFVPCVSFSLHTVKKSENLRFIKKGRRPDIKDFYKEQSDYFY